MFKDQPNKSDTTVSRRQLLKVGLLASVVCLNPLPAWARYSLSDSEVRSLSLYNTHTGGPCARLPIGNRVFTSKTLLSEINVLLRDHRADSVKPIDPEAIDLLFFCKTSSIANVRLKSSLVTVLQKRMQR